MGWNTDYDKDHFVERQKGWSIFWLFGCLGIFGMLLDWWWRDKNNPTMKP